MEHYVVSRITPAPIQLDFMDVIYHRPVRKYKRYETTRTRTDRYEVLSDNLIQSAEKAYRPWMTVLREFNSKYANFHEVEDKSTLYRTFYIPKGGKVPEKDLPKKKYTTKWRKIDAPNDDFKDCLDDLKEIFEDVFCVLYHQSAYAYVKKRNVYSAVQRHQENDSKWFLKMDFSNFFGSVTPEFLQNMFSIIYPFSYLIEKHEDFKTELYKALSLCFLNGGLPQGTPISPMLTNIIMIPIDAEINRGLWKKDKDFVYTRYADDILISSKYNFEFKGVENAVVKVMNKFKAPMSLNPEKTRYGSRNGRNWNLGLMYNKDGQITIGHAKKKMLKTSLYKFLSDYQSGNYWELHDVQVLNGNIQWYLSIEKKNIEEIIRSYDEKFNLNTMEIIKKYLKCEI